ARTDERIGRLKSIRNKNHETPEGGPNLRIKVGQTGLSKASPPDSSPIPAQGWLRRGRYAVV
ncbi:MAG: hypothetical protein ABSC63_21485, partial [Candidatus Binataceae bacterium]